MPGSAPGGAGAAGAGAPASQATQQQNVGLVDDSAPPDISSSTTITLNSPPSTSDPASSSTARMPSPLPVPSSRGSWGGVSASLPTSPDVHTPTHASYVQAQHANAASPSSVKSSPGPPARVVAAHSLLIPTDRPLEELEETWLPRLGKGRLRVAGEMRLPGYALYGIRSW